jgi:hypothetical protein
LCLTLGYLTYIRYLSDLFFTNGIVQFVAFIQLFHLHLIGGLVFLWISGNNISEPIKCSNWTGPL